MGDWTNGLRLAQLEAQIRAQVAQAAEMAGEHVLGVAQQLVPIEEGTLQRSGKTRVAVERGGATSTISFSTPYAARQHEEMGYRHDRGRQAKYLETPLRGEGKAVVKIIRGQVGQVFR